MTHYHYSGVSLEAKIETLRQDFRGSVDDSRENLLFFAARNGMIAAICRDIENYFADHGLRVDAEWSESSNAIATCLRTHLRDKMTHSRMHFITRENLWPRTGAPSDCVYSLKSIQSSEHYDRVKPKKAVEYDAILGSDAFRVILEKQILRTNYPFGYSSYSSF